MFSGCCCSAPKGGFVLGLICVPWACVLQQQRVFRFFARLNAGFLSLHY